MSEPALSSAEATAPSRSRAATRQLWVERLERFPASGMSTAEFCAAEGVSVASFYQWKRRLTAADRSLPCQDSGPRLLPARLHDQGAPIELVLPGGTIVRVAAGADETALRSVLQLLGVCSC
jgi:transposase